MLFEFGACVRDKISGFRGLATGRASYITGCDQYLVQPEMTAEQIENGNKPDAKWFDDNRLEKVSDPKVSVNTDSKTGADLMAPVK